MTPGFYQTIDMLKSVVSLSEAGLTREELLAAKMMMVRFADVLVEMHEVGERPVAVTVIALATTLYKTLELADAIRAQGRCPSCGSSDVRSSARIPGQHCNGCGCVWRKREGGDA